MKTMWRMDGWGAAPVIVPVTVLRETKHFYVVLTGRPGLELEERQAKVQTWDNRRLFETPEECRGFFVDRASKSLEAARRDLDRYKAVELPAVLS